MKPNSSVNTFASLTGTAQKRVAPYLRRYGFPNGIRALKALLGIITVVAFHTAQAAAGDFAVTGYGPWHIGMAKSAVAAEETFGPYREVRSTGGLETSNGIFLGKKANVSFVFGDTGLQKIQIWAYEGKDLEEALAGWKRAYEFTEQTFGDVEAPSLGLSGKFTSSKIVEALRSKLAASPSGDAVKVQLAPKQMPGGLSVFASFFRHPQYGYFVFLYHQKP